LCLSIALPSCCVSLLVASPLDSFPHFLLPSLIWLPFEMLDPDGNGDVSLEETIMKITELSLDRKTIAPSMHDVS
jgi:hypothetical protein